MAVERKITTRVEMKGDAEYRRKMTALNKDMQTFSGWAGTMAGVLAAKAITTGLKALANGLKSAFDASVEFESALTGVAKTTTLSNVQLQAFGDDMQELSTRIPMTAAELLNLAESAGQLGVVDDALSSIVEVAAAMGVSTNLSAESALTAFAQIGNVMGTTTQEYERMGSAVVELGNKSAATESEIVELAERLAGAANLVKISEPDILAYSSAMASVGIEAEAGGSAISKTWREIETAVATGSDSLNGFAEVAGMSATEFSRAWDADASDAFMSFLTGLGDAEANGQSAIATLSDLGITETRTVDTITRLIGANEMLQKSLITSNVAWEENTALNEEASKFYDTSASQIEMAENAVNNLAVAVGDKYKTFVVDTLTSGADAAQSLANAIEGQKSLPELINDVNASYEDQVSGINTAATQATMLTDRLVELGDVSGMTAQQQQEYLATLRLISEIMPGAAGIIDLQTGAIKGGTAALYENIDAAKENALQTADLDVARERYDALKLAQENLANMQALYTYALNESSTKEAEYNLLLQERADMEEKLQAEAESINAANGTSYTGYDLQVQSEDYANLSTKIEQAGAAMYDAQDKAYNLSVDVAEGAEIVNQAANYADEYTVKLSEMGQAYEDVGGQSAAAAEAMQQQVDDFQAMDDRLAELNASVVSAMETTRGQVADVVSGFGAIEMPETVSAKDTIANLQSQLDYMETYGENLKKVQELGLDQTLVEQLSDGSTESASILQGLVDDGGKSIDDLNAKFAEVTEGKDAMAETMALAVTDYETKADAIVTATNKMVENFNQEDGAKAAGALSIQGVIDGMNSKLAMLGITAAKVRSIIKSATGTTTPTNPIPQSSNAAGLDYVPSDGYVAELHRGEMVLTALEAQAYRAEQFANYGMLAALAGGGTTNNYQSDNRKAYTRGGDTYNYENQINMSGQVGAKQLLDGINAYSRRRARGRGRILG